MMYIKSVLFIVFFTIGSMLTNAQEQQSILSAPDNWLSERLTFPLGFAPSIDFIGVEDLRFAPGWPDTSSNEFWTYTFVWYIEKDSTMTEHKLSRTLEIYFDGLMGIDSKETADAIRPDKTLGTLVATNEGFKGTIRVYDAFFSKKEMILNVKVREAVCHETNKQLIQFEFSPKAFGDMTWEIFNDVRLNVRCD